MTVRLLLGVAFVINIVVLVVCTETTQETATSVSSANATSYASSSSSAKAVVNSEPKCRRAGVCPDNERLSTCIQAECRALNCTQKDKPVPCIRLDPKFCKKGCVCEEGYLRNEDGICVLEEKCKLPPTCGENEVLDNCSLTCNTDNCPKSADEEPMCRQSDPCVPACKCRFNYKRSENGTCIPTTDCPPFDCSAKPNEEFVACPPFCPTDECGKPRIEGRCPFKIGTFLQCNPKCQCKDGYGRVNGTCVPFEECTGVCPDNERYSTCIQAECRALNCTQKGQSVPCIRLDPTFCEKGCVCKEGYLRNADGICVLEEKCDPAPSCSSANEEFVPCMQGVCRAKDCSQKGKDVPCPDIPQEECDSGCICKEHFLRAANGSCVPEDQCEFPLTCGENEVLDNCSMTCNTDYCPKSANEKQVCTQSDPCVPACKCRFNYKRSENGTCIPTRDCPPFDCSTKPNEEFVACPPICPTDECGKPRLEGRCPFRIGIILECNPKCQCKDEYGRVNGTCVPFEECPDLCPTNEVYSPCVQQTCRPQNCTERDVTMESCPASDAATCQRGCVCQENYFRNDKGVCVSYEECGVGVCPDNERYSSCIQAECRALNCTQKDQSVPCIRLDPTFCEKGCVCEEGYLRNEDGICVLEEKCKPAPSCSSANEEFVPCMQGVCRAKDCSQKGKDVPCPDIPQEECDSGCICKEHFLRAANSSCVPEDQCESNKCPPFEQWDECANALCRAQFCSQKGLPVPCASVSECVPGCLCQEGYLRDESGVCVSEEDCKLPPTCGENEVLDNCSLTCNTDNCPKSADEEPMCTQSDPCVPACKCRFNYKRSENGTCIPTRDCPPFDCSARPNEEFVACPPFCPTDECGKPRLEGRCPFKIGTFLQCNPKCQCMEGYGRVNGTCVPFEECPDLCPTNEVYSPCVQQTCRPQNCSERDVTMESCPASDAARCQRGCVCQENYYRNDKGVCVSYEECGAPKTCGENEVLDNCSMTCNSDYCPKSADEEPICTQSDPCVPACKCRFNYKRSENGTCIPTRDCPPFDCSAKPNEEFVACPPICPTDECGKPRLEGRCPFKIGIILICKPKCQCKDGYGRVNGTCVPFDECPDLCPANEVYSSCVQQICRPQNCSDRDLVMETCPTSDVATCQRGCVCQENYYRNEKGVCISYEECGGPMCPYAHAEYTQNFKECPPNTCNSLVARYRCDENQKEGPGCICKSGYLRGNVTSPCIPICDCPEMKSSPDC